MQIHWMLIYIKGENKLYFSCGAKDRQHRPWRQEDSFKREEMALVLFQGLFVYWKQSLGGKTAVIFIPVWQLPLLIPGVGYHNIHGWCQRRYPCCHRSHTATGAMVLHALHRSWSSPLSTNPNRLQILKLGTFQEPHMQSKMQQDLNKLQTLFKTAIQDLFPASFYVFYLSLPQANTLNRPIWADGFYFHQRWGCEQ